MSRRGEIRLGLLALGTVYLALLWSLGRPKGNRGAVRPVLAAASAPEPTGRWLLDAPVGPELGGRKEAPAPPAAAAPPKGSPRRTVPLPTPQPLQEVLNGWLDDLRHDHVRGNATRAARRLMRHHAKEDVDAALESALFSLDYQERQYAARLLRWRLDWGGKDAGVRAPSPRLVEVTVEGLGNDRAHGGFHPFAVNAKEGTAFLLRLGDPARGPLEAALGSTDLQRRFLAAAILVWLDPERAPTPRVVPILLRQLRDNRIPNDAVLATATLYRLGPRIAPRLERALADADAQARDALGLLLHDFETPPRDWSDFATRRDLHRLSRLSDPAAQPNRQGFLRYVGAFEDFDPRR